MALALLDDEVVVVVVLTLGRVFPLLEGEQVLEVVLSFDADGF